MKMIHRIPFAFFGYNRLRRHSHPASFPLVGCRPFPPNKAGAYPAASFTASKNRRMSSGGSWAYKRP